MPCSWWNSCFAVHCVESGWPPLVVCWLFQDAHICVSVYLSRLLLSPRPHEQVFAMQRGVSSLLTILYEKCAINKGQNKAREHNTCVW